MSYSAPVPQRRRASVDVHQNALAILFLFLTTGVFLFRLLMTPHLMNMFMDYTSEGGPFYAKFHLGTYAITGTLLAALFVRPFVLAGDDIGLFRTLVRYAALLAGLVFYLILVGRLGATGFLIDTYFMAVLVALLMLTQNEQSRRIIATTVLLILICSAVIAIGEALTQRRVMPFTEGEPFFRATGLSGHPLALGAHCAIAIGFVPLTRWRIWVKAAVIFLLFVGCAAAGARLALMLSSAEIMLLLLFMRWPGLSPRQERKGKFIALLFTLLVGAALIAVLFAGGFLGRFGNSVVDANSMARVRIYQVFGYVGWKEILTGMDATALLTLVNQKLGLPFIESAPVIIIMLLGLPAAIMFTLIVVRYVLRLLRGTPAAARIAAAIFVLIDLSNNALATKTPDIILLTILIVGFRNPATAIPAPAAGRRSGVTVRNR
ncbi:VpsF family polysaccharide biosynthesis protein [Rhizobium puerariae]|uniref:VpsF family polysaccharide biosynthesis protein n=1 Tax=Rhizobium puerariae TaxID=1585791 RepID=A0ABV6AHJ7_9HYPH